MVKIMYYPENYWIYICYGKNWGNKQNTVELWFTLEENHGTIPKLPNFKLL